MRGEWEVAGSWPMSTVPEIIDPVFVKTSQYARFLLSENDRFGLVFVKTGSINSGTLYTGAQINFGDLASYLTYGVCSTTRKPTHLFRTKCVSLDSV
jgi:hypothetical protein